MTNIDDQIEKRERDLQRYFDNKERERLEAKGYLVPAIAHHRTAKLILEKTTNRLEKEFCKTIMAAFKNRTALHPLTFKNLYRLREKHNIGRINLSGYGTQGNS